MATPALRIQPRRHARLHPVADSLVGPLVTYAAFDLTSLAVLEGFPVKIAVVDLLWGIVLCASVSTITYSVWTRMLVNPGG